MTAALQNPIILAIVCLVACAVILGGIYRFGRNGILIRVFGVMIPAMGIVGYLGMITSQRGITPVSVAILLGTTAAIAALCVLWLKQRIVESLSLRINTLVSSVTEIAATAKETAVAVSEQSAVVADVTGTIQEVDQIGDATAQDAQSVLTTSSEAVRSSSNGLTRINDAISVIDAVGEVGNLLETINTLAEQTNLLAINAGIEAAKAGDFGSGFTVVAAEMRKLANQSKQTTSQIQTTINRTDEGRRAIETIHAVITELSEVLSMMTDKARQISSAAIQQSAGIGEISEAMKTVAEGGITTRGAAEQLETSVEAMLDAGEQLIAFVRGGRR